MTGDCRVARAIFESDIDYALILTAPKSNESRYFTAHVLHRSAKDIDVYENGYKAITYMDGEPISSVLRKGEHEDSRDQIRRISMSPLSLCNHCSMHSMPDSSSSIADGKANWTARF